MVNTAITTPVEGVPPDNVASQRQRCAEVFEFSRYYGTGEQRVRVYVTIDHARNQYSITREAYWAGGRYRRDYLHHPVDFMLTEQEPKETGELNVQLARLIGEATAFAVKRLAEESSDSKSVEPQ